MPPAADLGYNRQRMSTRLSAFLFFLAAACWLSAQDPDGKYAWPLAIDDGISSAFQEFRANHFHAGIDLRTMKRTGFPVLAVADGAIVRLTVSRRGYGRCLLLRHAGGVTSLYAHLDRFRPDLEAVVARVRSVSGKKYFGDHMLAGPVAVRRGEVIGYSGESGAGFAHLHLEIRDAADRAVNPLTLITPPSPDRQAPLLKGVLLRSRAGTLVNGDIGEFYFRLRRAGDACTPTEPLRINGPCDVVLHAVDLSGVSHVVAPYRLEASLDGRSVFNISFDRLSRDDNNQLGMLYDMSYSGPSTYFFNLCSQEGFALENSRARLADELQRLAPGRHELRVQVSDVQGNRSLAVLPLSRDPDGEPRSFRRRVAPDAPGSGRMQCTEFSVHANRGDVMVKAEDFPAASAQLRLRVIQGKEEKVIPAREYEQGLFFSFQPLNHEPHLQLRFEMTVSGLVVEARQKILRLVWLKNHMAQSVRFGEFAAEFGATTVREPTVLLLEEVALCPDLPMLGVPVRSEPSHFAFLDAVRYSFRVPAGTERIAQLGIFKYRPATRGWSYVPTLHERGEGTVSCRVLTAGTFALLRDVYPPAVSLQRPGSRQLDKLRRLVVRLSDRGKGIDDESLSLRLNGRQLDAEFDPDWGHVLVTDLASLRTGRNELRVQVADLGGNRSDKVFSFTLK